MWAISVVKVNLQHIRNLEVHPGIVYLISLFILFRETTHSINMDPCLAEVAKKYLLVISLSELFLFWLESDRPECILVYR